jgi:hypothetical protein
MGEESKCFEIIKEYKFLIIQNLEMSKQQVDTAADGDKKFIVS